MKIMTCVKRVGKWVRSKFRKPTKYTEKLSSFDFHNGYLCIWSRPTAGYYFVSTYNHADGKYPFKCRMVRLSNENGEDKVTINPKHVSIMEDISFLDSAILWGKFPIEIDLDDQENHARIGRFVRAIHARRISPLTGQIKTKKRSFSKTHKLPYYYRDATN